MGKYVVYADWKTLRPISEQTLAEILRRFRPDDEALCVWIHEEDATVLRLCMDVEAATKYELERLAREAVAAMAVTASLPGSTGEIVAYEKDDDDGSGEG